MVTYEDTNKCKSDEIVNKMKGGTE